MAYTPALAGESDEKVVAACITAGARKTIGKDAAHVVAASVPDHSEPEP